MSIQQLQHSSLGKPQAQIVSSSEKQISSTTYKLPQHIQDHLKHKQQIFNTRQSLLLFTCNKDKLLSWKIENKLKKERKYRQKTEKKEVARHVKSKVSAMFQQFPMINRGNSNTITKLNRRDSSLQLIMKHQSAQQQPVDSKKRQDKMDYEQVSKMLQNKHMIGAEKMEQKSYRRQSEAVINFGKVRSLEPIEVIPSIKGLKRRMSQNSLIESGIKLSDQSKTQRMSLKYAPNHIKKQDLSSANIYQLVPEEMAINNNCLQLTKQVSGRYEQSQFIDFFEDDKALNVKISTNEKMRLLKRREIVKSMKFIRNLGRELRSQRKQIDRMIRSQTMKRKQLQEHLIKMQAVEQKSDQKDIKGNKNSPQKSRKAQFQKNKTRSSDHCVLKDQSQANEPKQINDEGKARMSINDNQNHKNVLDLVPSIISNEQLKLSSDVSPNQNMTSYDAVSPNQSSLLKINHKIRNHKLNNSDEQQVKVSSSKNLHSNQEYQAQNVQKQVRSPEKVKDILDQLSSDLASQSVSNSHVNVSLSQISFYSKDSNARNKDSGRDIPKQIHTQNSKQQPQNQNQSPQASMMHPVDGVQSKKALQQVSKKIDILNQSNQATIKAFKSQNERSQQYDVKLEDNSYNNQQNQNQYQHNQNRYVNRNYYQDQKQNINQHLRTNYEDSQSQGKISDKQAYQQMHVTNDREFKNASQYSVDELQSSLESSDNDNTRMSRIKLNFEQHNNDITQSNINNAQVDNSQQNYQTYDKLKTSKMSQYQAQKQFYQSNQTKIESKEVLNQNNGFEQQQQAYMQGNSQNKQAYGLNKNTGGNHLNEAVEESEEYYAEDTSEIDSDQQNSQNQINQTNQKQSPYQLDWDNCDTVNLKQFNSFEDSRQKQASLIQDNQSLKALQNKIDDIKNREIQGKIQQLDGQISEQSSKQASGQFQEAQGLKVSKFQKLRQIVKSPESINNQEKMNSKKSSSTSQQIQEESYGIESNGANEIGSAAMQDYSKSAEYQQDSRMLLKLIQQANQNNYLDRILEEELSHISEEVESRFDETSGNQTIKSRFPSRMILGANLTHLSRKDSAIEPSQIQSLTPARINHNYDQMFLNQSLNEEKQIQTFQNGVKQNKQQPMRAMTMAIRDIKNHKKLDSNTYSSNLHISTNSKKDTQTQVNNNQVQYTPNEILEQSSQDSQKIGTNHIENAKQIHVIQKTEKIGQYGAPQQLQSTSYHIEKSDINDKVDQMHKIIFPLGKSQEYSNEYNLDQNSKQKNSEEKDSRSFAQSVHMEQMKQRQVHITKENVCSDSSELEDSYDSEVAQEHQMKDKNHQNRDQNNQFTQELNQLQINSQDINLNQKDAKQDQDLNRNLRLRSNESPFSKSNSQSINESQNALEKFLLQKKQVSDAIKMEDSYNQKKQSLQVRSLQQQIANQSNSNQQLSSFQRVTSKGLNSDVQEEEIEEESESDSRIKKSEFHSIEENQEYIDVKSNLDMLEQFDQNRKKKDKSSQDQTHDGSDLLDDLDDSAQLLNPNLLRRDNFDNMKLSDMEEYYLTEIEQQHQADFMQKIIQDEKQLKNQILLRQQRRQESRVKRRQTLYNGSQMENRKSNMNVATRSQIDKQSMLSQISHENKVKYLEMQRLKMLEMRKNIFVFNVNKDDVKNLSEIDLFKEDINIQEVQNAYINSRNYHRHLDQSSNSPSSKRSSQQSKLLRYSKFSAESSPRKQKHAITSRNEFSSSESSDQINNQVDEDSKSPKGQKKNANVSKLSKDIRGLKERRATNTLYNTNKHTRNKLSDQSFSSSQSQSLDSNKNLQLENGQVLQTYLKQSQHSVQKNINVTPLTEKQQQNQMLNQADPYINSRQLSINQFSNMVSVNKNEDEAKHGSITTNQNNYSINESKFLIGVRANMNLRQEEEKKNESIGLHNASQFDIQTSNQSSHVQMSVTSEMVAQPISDESIDSQIRPSMQLLRVPDQNLSQQNHTDLVIRASNEQIHKAANEQLTQDMNLNLHQLQSSDYSQIQVPLNFSQINNQQSKHQLQPSNQGSSLESSNQPMNQFQMHDRLFMYDRNQNNQRTITNSKESNYRGFGGINQGNEISLGTHANSQTINFDQRPQSLFQNQKSPMMQHSGYANQPPHSLTMNYATAKNAFNQLNFNTESLQPNQAQNRNTKQKTIRQMGASSSINQDQMAVENQSVMQKNQELEEQERAAEQLNLIQFSNSSISFAPRKTATQNQNAKKSPQMPPRHQSVSIQKQQPSYLNQQRTQSISYPSTWQHQPIAKPQHTRNKSYYQTTQYLSQNNNMIRNLHSGSPNRSDHDKSQTINYNVNNSTAQSPELGRHRRIKSNAWKNIKNNLKCLFDDLQNPSPVRQQSPNNSLQRPLNHRASVDIKYQTSQSPVRAISPLNQYKNRQMQNYGFDGPKAMHNKSLSYNINDFQKLNQPRVFSQDAIKDHQGQKQKRNRSKNEANQLIEQLSNKFESQAPNKQKIQILSQNQSLKKAKIGNIYEHRRSLRHNQQRQYDGSYHRNDLIQSDQMQRMQYSQVQKYAYQNYKTNQRINNYMDLSIQNQNVPVASNSFMNYNQMNRNQPIFNKSQHLYDYNTQQRYQQDQINFLGYPN